jgi:hypothetical protein
MPTIPITQFNNFNIDCMQLLMTLAIFSLLYYYFFNPNQKD